MTRAAIQLAAAAIVAIVITGCGGGGGGEAPSGDTGNTGGGNTSGSNNSGGSGSGNSGGGNAGSGGSSGGNTGGGSSSPGNGAPSLGTLAFTVAEDTTLSGQITATDPENHSLTFTRTSDPSMGAIGSFEASGAFVYQPRADVSGSDSFDIRVTDSAGASVNGTVTLTITPVNDPPTAVNDVLRADGAALESINVLGNDEDPDGDTLSVQIEEAPFAGSASVNADGSLRITGLPSGFRGLTRLRYKVTDAGGESASATVAVFVGTDPFRLVLAGEQQATGSAEVYMTDFVSPAWRLTEAASGTWRLRGFVTSNNGATVAYRREDSSSNNELSFVRTQSPDEQIRVSLPGGYRLVTDSSGRESYAVSPDGRWIAAIASRATPPRFALFVLNVDDPANLRDVAPAATRFASQLRFSSDSQQLYFLASEASNGLGKSLYRAALGGSGTAALISAPIVASSDDIIEYSVSRDQSRIVLHGYREGLPGLFYIDGAQPMIEMRLSHQLGFAEIIRGTTVGMPPELGGSDDLGQVAYTVWSLIGGDSAWMAGVGPGANGPQRIAAAGSAALGIRPDDGALLYTRNSQVYESVSGFGSEERIGGGMEGWYDATRNVVILKQTSPYEALAVARRGQFGVAEPLGTPGRAARYVGLSGIERAVVLLGEGPAGGATPAAARIALVNALAPDKLHYVAEFQSPLGLNSDAAVVVTY